MGNFESFFGEEKEDENVMEREDFSPLFLEKYEPERKLGVGAFGSAFLVRERSSGKMYCAKRVRNDPEHHKEVAILQKVQPNPHTVNFKEKVCDQQKGQLYIVMEYCDGGNLRDWIKRNHRNSYLTETVVLQMLWRICEAVQGCHELNILHRDLKPENIFLHSTPSQCIKVGDFGVARELGQNAAARSYCGTVPYMAPEVFQAELSNRGAGPRAGYNYKAEVWSIGCILLDMSNKRGLLLPERQYGIGSSTAEALNKGDDPENDIVKTIDEDVPKDWQVVRRILPRMICGKAEFRISLEEILTDPEIHQRLRSEPQVKWSQNNMQVTKCDMSAV